MEKTLQIHLEEQAKAFAHLLAKYAEPVKNESWYVPGQVALDIVSGRITE